MKQNKIILILCIILVALLAVAGVLYSKLSESFVPSTAVPPETSGVSENIEKAPDFVMKDGNKNDVKLSDFFGKPIVLNFWATWCPPCKAELPDFEKAFKEYGDKVQFIMLNQTDGGRDTFEVVKKFIADNGYTFPVYYDDTFDATYAYSAFSIPMTVVIGADGKLVDTHIGMISGEKLVSYIEKVIEE